jgi:hypothetical protein
MLMPLAPRRISIQVDASNYAMPGAPHAVTAASAFVPPPRKEVSLGHFGR